MVLRKEVVSGSNCSSSPRKRFNSNTRSRSGVILNDRFSCRFNSHLRLFHPSFVARKRLVSGNGFIWPYCKLFEWVKRGEHNPSICRRNEHIKVVPQERSGINQVVFWVQFWFM
ncbi:hypothetical protein CTI12_AA502560 [Artemisia annua]|uniref:Uncharacterized protein n=1 Tax=Artemisia annua TaxID=35608 RepID=A0A2U1LD84_ARTAN|nr:hypothetical protein CTI12_AA502560 [Artemisia annua]